MQRQLVPAGLSLRLGRRACRSGYLTILQSIAWAAVLLVFSVLRVEKSLIIIMFLVLIFERAEDLGCNICAGMWVL